MKGKPGEGGPVLLGLSAHNSRGGVRPSDRAHTHLNRESRPGRLHTFFLLLFHLLLIGAFSPFLSFFNAVCPGRRDGSFLLYRQLKFAMHRK